MVEHTTENRGVGGSIPPLTTQPGWIVLLCAPSLGVLDNWLPVLDALRRDDPDVRIAAILPDRETVAQLDPDDTAHRLADELVDRTLAPLVDGGWVVADGFLGAGPLTLPRRITRRIAVALGGRRARLRTLLRLLRTPTQRARRSDPSLLADPANRLLYDVQLHDKPHLTPLLAALGATPRFSHHHGIELEEPGTTRVPPPDPEHVHMVLAYGPSEVDGYAANYGIPRERVRTVGVLRHDPAWVRTVVDRSAARHTLPFERFVFVVSRPAGSPYLPHSRKVAALEALHTVAWEEHGLPLVLRTHPKEQADGTLDAALPASGEGVSWARSRAHPFHLATGAWVAATFFSGVSVDLVALGVPVVELLDVRGLTPYDSPGAPRDGRGRPSFGPYRRDGLVIPADDVDDLRAAFARIDGRRGDVLAELQRTMRGRFADPADGASQVAALLSG